MNFDSVVRRALSGSGASAPHSGSLSNGFVRVSPLFLLLAATSVHAAPPEIDPIVNQFTRELPVTPLQIDLGARDLIDGDGIAEFSFTLNPVPTVNFCSIDHVAPAGTGTLSCDPQLNDGGNYTVTVTATDDSLEQESASTQFVLDVNTTPSINGILTQSVVEAGSIDITLDASDPDPGDGLTFSFAAAESFCSITFDNGNGLGTLTCSPALGDANSYTVTITATDDAAVQASASTSFTLTVGANQVPTADTVAITGTAVLGATLNGTYNYDDTEDDAEGTSTFKWYRNDVEIDGATGTSYTVVVEDVETTLTFGVTPVAQTGASPGTEEHSTGVLVANSTPILQDITDKSVVEGGTVNIALLASDPDGDVILFSHAISPPLPPSGDICAVTSENGAGAGTLTCAPSVGDEGTYLVTVTVTDNGDSPESTSDTFLLTVGPNQPPTAINVAVSGNATLGSTLTATYQYQDAELDPEGTSTFRWLRDGIEIPVAIGTSYTVVPDDVETNLRFEVTPVATVGATTGTPVQSADFPISNQPPVVANIANQSVGEAASLDIALSATDPEGDGLSFSFTSIPVQAQIFCSITADDGNGTGTLTCSPAVGDAALGPYTITVTATDDASSPASGSDAFTLTVEPNQPPTASNVGITGDPTVNSVLTGNYVYADTEDDLEGTSTFRWLRDGVPISGAVAQTYTVVIDDVETSLRFEVTPVAATGALTGTPVQSGDLLISNTAPSITGQVVIEIAEEGSREIVLADLIVTDLDSVFPDDFTLSVQDGANYTRSGVNGNIVTPALDFNGDLTVPVTVNDGFVDSSVFNLVVTVTPVNDAPVFISVVPPGLSTPEDTTLTIPVSALDISDPDNVPADFVLTLDPVLPPDANYILAGPASITPAENFNGELSVRATVSDGDLNSAPFLIPVTVTAENDLPVLDAEIGPQTAIENSLFTLNVIGNFSDADGDTLTFSATGLPASGRIAIDPVSGVILGTPTVEDARDNAPYVVTVIATDPAGASVSDEFDLTVSALDRANIGLSIGVTPESGLPNDQLTWTFTAANPIGPAPGENVELTGSFFGSGLSVAASGGSGCSITVQTGRANFVCTIGALPVGVTASINFTTTASQATEVVAFGTAAGALEVPIDPNISDNSAVRAVGVAESFSDGAVQFLGGETIRSVAAGDFNGDGTVDLVVGTAAGQPVQVYLGDAPRESCGCQRDFVTTPISIPDTGANEGVAVADFDNDGFLDLVIANGGGQPDAVYTNDGSGNFVLAALLAPSNGRDVAVGDFNRDGNPDVAIAATSPNPVYFGDGAGGFGAGILLGNVESFDVAVGRFDGDLFDDLVFANVGSDSQVWLSNGSTGFTQGAALPIGDAVAVAAADFNGDNRDDLVFGRIPGAADDVPANPVMINQGGGTFGGTPQLLGISPTLDVLIGDVSDDGLPDLVFINQSGVHQIWTASGGSFALHPQQIIDIGARTGVVAGLGFADTDDPGGADLALGGALTAGAAVYLNDSAGNLGLGDAVAPVITLNGVASVDVPSGEVYADAGATAVDNIDGDLSASIVVSNTVNTAVVGSYTVTYNVQDFAGNAAVQITRTVNVTAAVGRGGGGGGALDYWFVTLLTATWLLLMLRTAGRTAASRDNRR